MAGWGPQGASVGHTGMGVTEPWEVGQEGQGTPVDSAFLAFQPFL